MNPETGRIARYYHAPDLPDSLSADTIRGTLEARDGAFWVATTRGIDLFDRQKGQVIQRYPFTRDFSQTIPFSQPVVLCESYDGVIWIGFPDGLARIDASPDGSSVICSREVLMRDFRKQAL